jgi:hypothetical protein
MADFSGKSFSWRRFLYPNLTVYPDLSPIPTVILIKVNRGRTRDNQEELMGLIAQERGDLSQVPFFPSTIALPFRDIKESGFPL